MDPLVQDVLLLLAWMAAFMLGAQLQAAAAAWLARRRSK